MVSTYAPYRDGIAAYAVQEVAALRRQGHHVEVLSPMPSAAHHHLPLPSARSMVELVRMAAGYDRVVVQFHPDSFFSPDWGPGRRQAVWAAFGALAARTSLELRIHEIDYRVTRLRGALRRLALHRADAVVVHTGAERRQCVEAFGLPEDAVTVVDHGHSMTAKTSLSRAEARRELGIPAEDTVFLSIGFVQPHKGFDRAVRAFARLTAPARLYVVGDTRTDDDEWVWHCDELEALTAATPGAELRRGYVSDEQFDLWITAADRVVLPYRQIWSSGVAERAVLLGTPTIVTRVGGLEHQVGEHGVVVDDDDQLAEAMADVVGTSLRPVASHLPDTGDRPPSRTELQAVIDGARRVDPAVTAGASRPTRRLRSRRLGPVPRPAPTSARPVNALVKKLTERLTRWMVDPVADHLDHAIDALSDDVEALDRRISALEEGNGDGQTPSRSSSSRAARG